MSDYICNCNDLECAKAEVEELHKILFTLCGGNNIEDGIKRLENLSAISDSYTSRLHGFFKSLIKALKHYRQGCEVYGWDTPQAEYIEDEFGNRYFKYCPVCHSEMQIVRPGKTQCPKCD